ncbi:uncharacterized protein pre-mod(mdg4)-AB [Epargyreus clarus]|uniref:uncharacterized protein pre-mod(mdg4)-AB n=1 Tax=Epargyreus clarus TaxID=520877 RepID=UPI003C2DCF5D
MVLLTFYYYYIIYNSLGLEFFLSRIGNEMLKYQGYKYHLRHQTEMKRVWRCSKNYATQCKATLTTVYNELMKVTRIPYDVVLSQRGKRLIMVDGYTFSQTKSTYWTCSSKFANCKAKLKLNNKEEIIEINNVHSHEPRKYVKSSDDSFEFIELIGGKILLMAEGFTFAKASQRHWYCSKKSKGCKARVHFNAENTVIQYDNNHNHQKPVYKKLLNGHYMKCMS